MGEKGSMRACNMRRSFPGRGLQERGTRRWQSGTLTFALLECLAAFYLLFLGCKMSSPD